MKFYIDFEATQFTEQIISIGCIDEAGHSFYSLVKPQLENFKISNFITELTGISKNDLINQKTADDVFIDFFDYVIESCSENNSPIPEFYCYGDSDSIFLKKTIKNMNNPKSIIVAQSIIATMIDYSIIVRKYFNSDDSIALKKVCSFIEDENIEQKHNALDDAIMLMEVEKKLTEKCKPEDKEEIRSLPGNIKPKVSSNKKTAPKSFLRLEEGGTRWEPITGADKNNYKFKGINCLNKEVYFNDIETAAMWCIKYSVKGVSPKNKNQVMKVEKNINKALNKNSKYCGIKWFYKGDDEEC